MADDFDQAGSEQRFQQRKIRVDDFYKYLDVTYKSINKVPESLDEEQAQKRFIINELDVLEQRMDTFRNELRSN